MSVELKPITRENWQQCARMKVRDDQARFVANNAYSLAQAAYEPECNVEAVYADETLVGFVLYGQEPKDGTFWISRLMIGAEFQGKGYGRAALRQMIANLRKNPDCKAIHISYVKDNEPARKLYASEGFVETGELIGEPDSDGAENIAVFKWEDS